MQVVFHLLLHVLKRILETVPVVLRCLVNKSVVKWFVTEMYRYRNYARLIKFNFAR